MVTKYVFDTNVFYTLGHFYPSRFPTIWSTIDDLVDEGKLISVKEVRRELEANCPFDHIASWVKNNRSVFRTPSEEELEIVARMFKKEQFRGLVRRNNILKGMPVADPFIVAAGKVYEAYVVTQEAYKRNGARIPNACEEFGIDCIDFETFLEYEDLKY